MLGAMMMHTSHGVKPTLQIALLLNASVVALRRLPRPLQPQLQRPPQLLAVAPQLLVDLEIAVAASHPMETELAWTLQAFAFLQLNPFAKDWAINTAEAPSRLPPLHLRRPPLLLPLPLLQALPLLQQLK